MQISHLHNVKAGGELGDGCLCEIAETRDCTDAVENAEQDSASAIAFEARGTFTGDEEAVTLAIVLPVVHSGKRCKKRKRPGELEGAATAWGGALAVDIGAKRRGALLGGATDRTPGDMVVA